MIGEISSVKKWHDPELLNMYLLKKGVQRIQLYLYTLFSNIILWILKGNNKPSLGVLFRILRVKDVGDEPSWDK